MQVTWKHRDTDFQHPLSFEQKVEVFYHQALGWQLHLADMMANGGQPLGGGAEVPPLLHSGFAVLQICLSYFETVGHYEQKDPRTRKAGDYFKAGVRSVLPSLLTRDKHLVERLLAALYKGARCGLYHNSSTLPGVGLGQPPDGSAIGYDASNGRLAISPERLPKELKRHLERFRDELLNGNDVVLRRNFERRFHLDFGR
jgi:hypothetical protein